MFTVSKKKRSQEISTDGIARGTKEYISDIIFSSPAGQQLVSDSILLYDRLPFELRRSNFESYYTNFRIWYFTPRNVAPIFSRSHSALGALPLELTTFTGQRTFTLATYVSTKLISYRLLHQFKRACEAIEGRFIFVSSAQSERLTAHGKMLMEDKLQLKKSDNLQEINICYLPGGRSVWEKTVPEVLSTARGRRPRAVLKTKGTVFSHTDRPSPVNNIFIFFLQYIGFTEY